MDRLREAVSGWLDIPEEALGAPRVVLSGRTEALIENAGAIGTYVPGLLRVRTAGGTVTMEGEDLVIRAYSRAALLVTGRIRRVTLEGREDA